ncbi:MAG: hypothetical protein HQK61_10580, partial [Desulfamplus sp.]|nr:hypothetical protein [Desulfamplus sp.]
MNPSFNALNSPSTNNTVVIIRYPIITFLFAISFLFLSIIAIPPETAFASVKKNKIVTKSSVKSTTRKTDANGHSDMFLYFTKKTGNKVENYNEYIDVVKKNETVV